MNSIIPENNDIPSPIPALSMEPVLESGQDAANILLRNSSFFLGADTIIKILSFIFNVYVVRQLGDERFGFYSAALAYAGIFSIIGDLGMTQYATREIARGRHKADDLFWNLVILRLILAVVATTLITLSAYYVAGYNLQMVFGIFLVCIGFFFYAFTGPVEIVLSGKERIDYISIMTIIGQLGFVVVGTLVLVSGISFHGLIVATYIAVPVATLFGIRYIKRLNLATLKFKITPGIWASILKHSLPFALITFTLVAATDLDTVLLSLWRSPHEVGWYKAAYNLVFKLLFIRGALLTTLTPQMSRYYGVSSDRVRKTFNASFKILWMFSLPIALATSVLARPIIAFLYTDEFVNSATVLAILIWALPLLNLSSLCGSVTTATDKEKKAAQVYTIAAIINLTTNLIAIPIYGYIGAAVATVITEAVALTLFYSVLHTEFPLTDLANTLIKPAIAAGVMAIAVFVFIHLPLFVLIVIGATVYGAVLLALKPFNELEIKILWSIFATVRSKLKWGTA